jgi:hypothetical protein
MTPLQRPNSMSPRRLPKRQAGYLRCGEGDARAAKTIFDISFGDKISSCTTEICQRVVGLG